MNPDIKTIEKQTKEQIIDLLQSHNLGTNKRRKYKDYSEAKKLVFKRRFINCDIYDKQISWICDFLKL